MSWSAELIGFAESSPDEVRRDLLEMVLSSVTPDQGVAIDENGLTHQPADFSWS